MSTTQVRTADPSSRPAVAIQATSTPVLSYALAHNRVPVVSRLAFTNHGGAVRGATVRLGVRDAEGPIGTPVELLVDLDAGQTTVLNDVGLVMDPAAMLQIEEQRPGSIEIDLLVDGEDVGGTAVPVQVLAANQWLAAPVPLALEMLAAHVLPHHPTVTTLIGEAADLLEQRTGSGSVQGYQSGPERVDEIVAALTEAMHRRAIRYTEPPASWADVGQKVRTPGDVLDGRVGTCLDTVVTLAAALEQAGIRPLLWAAEGHAFLGYWREERSAESVATTDVAPLVDLVDLGLIRLVETTLLTSRGSADADLHGAAYSAWLAGAGDLDRVLGVTDVHRARRDGIVPLPARTRGRDGAVQVFEYRPAVHSVAARPVERPVAPGGRGDQPGRPEIPARVQQWKSSLLDLSLRNRLINYSERAGLPLTVPRRTWPRSRTCCTAAPPSSCCRATASPRCTASAGCPRPATYRPRSSPTCSSSAGRCTPRSARAPTCRGCATSPTGPRPCARRPAPTTCTWPWAAWCGSSTAGRCAPRWCWCRSR